MGKAHASAPAAAPKTPKTAEPTVATADLAEATDISPPSDEAADSGGPFTSAQLSRITEAPSATARLKLLATALGVAHYASNPRSLVWVDFCFGVLTFALEEASLPVPKALALLTVANVVFGFATSASFESNELPSTEATYAVFRDLVRSHSVAASIAPSDALWDASDVARIVAFMSSTFFRHLRAYQHVFQSPRPSLEREVALVVESPLPPMSLATATAVPLE